MKKYLLVALALVITFTLAGCGTDNENVEKNDVPTKNVLSGLWEGDVKNEDKKIYFDCEDKYDYSYPITVLGKTSYYGYNGTYKIDGNNITLYTDNKNTGEIMVAEEFHFYRDTKDIICNDSICYYKSTTDYSCESLANHTK